MWGSSSFLHKKTREDVFFCFLSLLLAHPRWLFLSSRAMIKNHLHLAAYEGHDEVVKSLLKQSANKKQINSKDKNGWCPLHCAAARGHLKVSLCVAGEMRFREA